MFLNKNKRKVNLSIESNNSNEVSSGIIPPLFEQNGIKRIDNISVPMDLSSRESTPDDSPSPSSVTMRKKFKLFSDDSMDTSECSSVTLVKYSHQPFDDFKKPFDCFVAPMDPSSKGFHSNRSSVSSLLSVSSLTGRSSYDLNKQSSLEKFESFRKSSLDISSSSAKSVKKFISGVVTPRIKRKAQHSTSSDTLRSESIENMSQTSDSDRNSASSFTKIVQSLLKALANPRKTASFQAKKM